MSQSETHLSWRVLLVAVLCLVPLIISACTTGPGSVSTVQQESEPATELPPPAMPDLVGMTLLQARDSLDAIGWTATVYFPAEEITRTIEATYIAGVSKPEHESIHMFPARELDLSQAATEHYRVAEQSPLSGSELSTEASLALTATPNWDPTSPWPLDGHVIAVQEDGAEWCFDCHEQDSCSQCHVAIN